MRRPLRLALFVAVTLSLVSLHTNFARSASSPILRGKVTRVLDGDTIEVQLSSGPLRVRLYGIDAPEKKQPYGPEAKQALERLINEKDIELEPDRQDRYGRMVGVVYINRQNVNKELVRQGRAWAYRAYLKRSDSQYCKNEQEARVAHRGVWALPSADLKAPWEWRSRKRREKYTDFRQETEAACVAAMARR